MDTAMHAHVIPCEYPSLTNDIIQSAGLCFGSILLPPEAAFDSERIAQTESFYCGLLTMNGSFNSQTSASIANTEICESHKKFTVYKVVVSSEDKNWFVFRRYNEFNRLYEILKKQNLCHNLKLPGKKLFGNNFDPAFIQARREGLDEFVQKVTTDPELFNHPDVRQFLGLDKRTSNQSSIVSEDESFEESSEKDSDDEPINLGPTEKLHCKPTDFEFLKVIGKGSFGKVLLARHKCDKEIFAVKVLEKKMILKRNETRHIMAERNVLLQATHHPFLVSLHFSFQTHDKLYFVLDFINGGELFFHLQRERYFPEPRAQFYAVEMASALGYLHQIGIVYRDLKPENILLKYDGHIVLTDFGLCKEGIFSDNKTSTFCGTPEYLAPEVLRKQPYTKAVDWWCFGSVLYEMLYGLPPFYSRDTSEMYENILHKPIRLRTNISAPARNLLDQLLQKKPEFRLGSGKNDVVDICEHEFFKSINWNDFLEKKVPPPFIPNVQDKMDLRNIDPEFTKEPVPASVGVQTNTVSASVIDADNAFEGFSYVPPMDIVF